MAIKIKEVDSWDGDSARWDDAESYCSACLIDVNPPGEEKTKALCMLPVREPGDPSDVMVDKAVYAAAAGRGITRVRKPEGISQEVWDKALRNAARKIIAAYRAMDKYAPESVYRIAGEEPPEEAKRAVNLWDIMHILRESLGERATAIDVYVDGASVYAVINVVGRLYRIPVAVGESGVVFGEPEPVQIEFLPSKGAENPASVEPAYRSLSVVRQSDGTYRWAALACTALINRVGEIDSTELFDNFVKRIESRQADYPELDLLHLPGTSIGKADFVARDGYALVASGIISDPRYGEAIARAVTEQPGQWGVSIAYLPKSTSYLRVDKLTVPVYTDGILRKISIVPARAAASWGTNFLMGGGRMNQRIKDVLYQLLGRSELVEEIEESVDQMNERATSGEVVARATEQKQDAEKETEEAEAEAQAFEVIRAVVSELTATVQGLKERLASLERRLASLEQAEKKRAQYFVSDLPRWRELVNTPAYNDEASSQAIAPDVKAILTAKGLKPNY